MGLSNPNSSALAMAPFGAKAGSAAALMGFLQMGIGALASVCVGVLKAQQLFPIAGIFVGTSLLALLILILGSRNILRRVEVTAVEEIPVIH
jgi:DHA1 family bicyclomycin/chloramphenicol resistance-like MFS transporter